VNTGYDADTNPNELGSSSTDEVAASAEIDPAATTSPDPLAPASDAELDPAQPDAYPSGSLPRMEELGDARVRLDELIDRDGLTELCHSFFSLFGIPVRVYTSEGLLLADASLEHEICAYMGSLVHARGICGSTVTAAKAREPDESGVTTHPCFTGNVYRIVAIDYDGRRIGRLILGPYLPAEVKEVPASLLDADYAIDPQRARSLLNKVPRAKEETVSRLAAHLKRSLDLILFHGHKSMLTSQMHLASVRESYRELSEKNRRLQEAYDRLRELDRLKSSFLATVSHELRTPLTSIIGYSEMLSEGIAGALTADQGDFVKTIHDKGEQLLGLITGLLDLSKLESGSLTIRPAPTEVRQLLENVVTTLTPAVRKKSITLRTDIEPNVATLKADAERLRQVFINLVDNAVKFTPQGGTITIMARNLGVDYEDADVTGFSLLAPVQTRIEIRVSDSGIGIPAKERKRVFDPFYQVDSSSTREYGGTGLGLSIVKRLVDAHGGTIHIEDNVPQGTVFVVRLPSADPS
jgi:two-component system sensor histidine kinase BarA